MADSASTGKLDSMKNLNQQITQLSDELSKLMARRDARGVNLTSAENRQIEKLEAMLNNLKLKRRTILNAVEKQVAEEQVIEDQVPEEQVVEKESEDADWNEEKEGSLELAKKKQAVLKTYYDGFPSIDDVIDETRSDSQKTYTILSQLPSLTNLLSLTIQSICGDSMSQFDLPNLKRLVFTSCLNIDWIKNFSRLESIEYTIGNCHSHVKDLPWPSTLTHLRIIFDYDGYFDRIQRSLVHLSSLDSLEIYQKEKGTLLPNGQLWGNLIPSSLPLLKIFKYYFQFEYSSQLSNQIEQVISSFSTPFYVLKNKWFIRYDIPDRYHGRAILNSLPFSFQIYTTFQGSIIKTILTLLDDDNNDFYTNVFSIVKKIKSPLKLF
ncbi:unnamed protein product [Rotaria sp. Silwood1]|nr:unnamed protein product [Rotaria sp. Silwood1]